MELRSYCVAEELTKIVNGQAGTETSIPVLLSLALSHYPKERRMIERAFGLKIDRYRPEISGRL